MSLEAFLSQESPQTDIHGFRGSWAFEVLFLESSSLAAGFGDS